MAKAILVLDKMPNNCNECDFSDYDDGGDNYRAYMTCLLDKRDYPEEFQVESFSSKCPKPDWCPLKEMPFRYDDGPWDYDSDEYFAKGFNKCLDSIEGIDICN